MQTKDELAWELLNLIKKGRESTTRDFVRLAQGGYLPFAYSSMTPDETNDPRKPKPQGMVDNIIQQSKPKSSSYQNLINGYTGPKGALYKTYAPNQVTNTVRQQYQQKLQQAQVPAMQNAPVQQPQPVQQPIQQVQQPYVAPYVPPPPVPVQQSLIPIPQSDMVLYKALEDHYMHPLKVYPSFSPAQIKTQLKFDQQNIFNKWPKDRYQHTGNVLVKRW